MKSSYYSCVVAVVLLATVAGLIITVGPAVSQGQTRRARDRSSRVARSVEPNAVARDAGQTVTPSAQASEAVQSTGAAQRQSRWAAYDIILQRNIFSRQRVAPRPADEGEPRQVVLPDPETYFLLRGVVQQNNEFIAFIEDTQGGRVLQLRQNESVARGVLKSLSLDSIEYQFGDRTITVKIGSDLEGGRGRATAEAFSNWPETSAPAARPAQTGQQQAPSGDEADILKRLMEQRRQQLGQ